MNKASSIKGALTATLITTSYLTGTAYSAININTSGSGVTGDIQIVIPEITFTATSSFTGGVLAMIIDEAFLSDEGFTINTNFDGPLLVGGTIFGYADSGFVGNDISLLDATVYTQTANSFNIGDSVTFAGGTITMNAADPSTAIFASGSYDVFLASSVGERLSTTAVAAVPEPSSAALLGLGGLALFLRRKR